MTAAISKGGNYTAGMVLHLYHCLKGIFLCRNCAHPRAIVVISIT
jgi:hypothetical protein